MWYLEKIPKTLHLYWGGQSLSFLRYMTIYSFREYNPNWIIIVHTPKNISTHKTWQTGEHKEYVPNEENYFDYLSEIDNVVMIEHDFNDYKFNSNASEVHKADFLRWKVLYDIGGLWSDFDILYIKSMDELSINTEENKDVDVGICAYGRRLTAIGFLLGCEKCDFWQTIQGMAQGRYNPDIYQCIGSDLLNYSYDHADKIKESFPNLNPIMIDKNSVYYLNYKMVDKMFDETVDIPKEVIGIHWYAGSVIAQDYESLIKFDNYKEFDSTICKYIGKVLT